MTYRRVIPRDLFNEANLLKCWGQLWLLLDNMHSSAEIRHTSDNGEFQIEQCEGDGSICVQNLHLVIGGHRCAFYRPLNAREPWPVWCIIPVGEADEDEIKVFTEHGQLTPEFLAAIRPL